MSLVLLLAVDRQRSVLSGLDSIGRVYTAYGYFAIQGGPISAFCGEPIDPLTGCYPLGNGHRQYNPKLMRLQSPDEYSPFGEGGLNVYMYCKGDPVNRHDPSGSIPLWLPQAQRALTAILHVVSPLAIMLGPPPKGGLATNASRMALAGSGTSVVGAGLGLAGVGAAPYVSAAGTGLLMTGAGIRLAKSLWDKRSALWRGTKKNFRSNLRTIFKVQVKKKKRRVAPPSGSPRKAVGSVYTIEHELEEISGKSSSSTVPDLAPSLQDIREV
ncbi:RHS repeat-associated core domain-containing protein [Pseudomonas shirazica]|uniref:RHS repeat-associated core domain-containing protein n=1 Tax=Pseudomonas shirazica TaxID=1940636 RepID=UPI001EDD0477|nr:RHS repeat-associated core domain-containing protein [Pseudomonas shirazica]